MKLSQGAEASIYLQDGKIIKERSEKGYRYPELDASLRKSRTKREAKVLEKLPVGVSHPGLIRVDDSAMVIEMEYIRGEKLRDILDTRLELCRMVGCSIAAMHKSGIIHGDLTTSNMICSDGKVFLIDFGLSFFSNKIEDRAVDLHLLKQALESKHHTVWEKAYSMVLEGYGSMSGDAKEVFARLHQVELRGRNKSKY